MKFWQKRKYIPFTLCMLIVGVAVSASFPLVAFFLVTEIHVSPTTVGLFFLTSLTAPFVSITTGRISDYFRKRKVLIIFSAIWLSTGWVLIALVRDIWTAVAVGSLFFCINGTLSAQIFALLRDIMDYNGEKHMNAVNSTVRTAFSLGWVLGPVLGSWLAFLVGVRITFLVTACLCLISLVPLWFLKSGANYALKQSTHPARKFSPGSWINIICFSLACVLVLSGDSIQLAYLPLYIVEILRNNIVIFGSLMSTSAILELLIIPLFGILADKFGMKTIMIVGIVFCMAEYTILATSPYIWLLYVAQAFNACVIAAFQGLGINYAQQILRGQTGLASSIFFGAQSLASPFGSLIGSYGVLLLGIPHVFFLPLAACVFSLVLLLFGRSSEEVSLQAIHAGVTGNLEKE